MTKLNRFYPVCLSWSNFDRDNEVLKAIGVNHYRFGIEWAGAEPQPGRYNEAAIRRCVELSTELRREASMSAVTSYGIS
jgi:beta-glucosidase